MLTKFESYKTYVFRKALHDEQLPECAYLSWASEVDGMTVEILTKRIGCIAGLTIIPKWCEEADNED